MNHENVTDAWKEILGDRDSAKYRVSLVADAESACDVGLRLVPTSGGFRAEVYVIRSDGVELPPFDSCIVSTSLGGALRHTVIPRTQPLRGQDKAFTENPVG